MPTAMKVRLKQGAEFEAAQWYKNGDHPDDQCIVIHGEGIESFVSEGKIVRYFRHPEIPSYKACPLCCRPMHDHGFMEARIRQNQQEAMICPGDWILKSSLTGLYSSMGDAIFRRHYVADEDPTLAELRRQKNKAYTERNAIVAALSKCFPSFLGKHQGADWEDDWRNIVFVMLPTGQVSWHIHDSELDNFGHLLRTTVPLWDGHDEVEKYRRLAALKNGQPWVTVADMTQPWQVRQEIDEKKGVIEK